MCCSILPFVNTALVAIGVGFGAYQYQKQQVFKRIQNLSSLWEKFFDSKEFLELFDLCNEIEMISDQEKINRLGNYDKTVKWKFLAMLEEVAIYASIGEVDEKYAIDFFKWHFYFVFKSDKTAGHFWGNMGGDEEKNSKSWKKQQEFVKKIPIQEWVN